MRRGLFACLLIVVSIPAFASVQCTTESKTNWLSEARMRQMIADLGHKVSIFKVSGNCYEIYGRDSNGHRIEIYFNPVDGTIVKQNTL
jgi:hypothetical protein